LKKSIQKESSTNPRRRVAMISKVGPYVEVEALVQRGGHSLGKAPKRAQNRITTPCVPLGSRHCSLTGSRGEVSRQGKGGFGGRKGAEEGTWRKKHSYLTLIAGGPSGKNKGACERGRNRGMIQKIPTTGGAFLCQGPAPKKESQLVKSRGRLTKKEKEVVKGKPRHRALSVEGGGR